MSDKKNVIVRIAGAAGDGIASSGELFGKTCSRMGLHVMAYNAYQSAIRGGHVWLQLNVGEAKTLSHGEKCDVSLLLNKTSPEVHIPDMKEGGSVFYDASVIKKEEIEAMRSDLKYYGLDFKELVNIEGASPVMKNTMLVAALIQSLGLDTSMSLDFLEEKFSKKGEEVVKVNQQVFNIGSAWASENVTDSGFALKGDGTKRMFLTGNDAFGMGLQAGGLKFYAAYPMSPATGVLHYLATQAKEHKIVVKQCEDELAVVNYAVGAGHAGARTALATAGGGFCLMIEGLGLAGMTETPLVAICVMRGGPSTGIPTKQEQADLGLAFASNGDFPKFVIAPKDPEDAFYQAARALNIAEKYQTPVIIFSDLFLSEHYQTVDPYDFSKIEIERGKLITEWNKSERYKRYAHSDDGIPERLLPGAPGQMYTVASDEHTEEGILISDVLAGLPESLEVRNKMHARRMQKEETMRKEDSRAPELTGPEDAEITLMGWGSTSDMIDEAVELLNAEGIKTNHLHFTDIYPLNKEKVLEKLNSCKRIIAIENNISNQFPKYLLSQTAFEVEESVNRYDGEPFTGEFISKAVKELKVPTAA